MYKLCPYYFLRLILREEKLYLDGDNIVVERLSLWPELSAEKMLAIVHPDLEVMEHLFLRHPAQ